MGEGPIPYDALPQLFTQLTSRQLSLETEPTEGMSVDRFVEIATESDFSPQIARAVAENYLRIPGQRVDPVARIESGLFALIPKAAEIVRHKSVEKTFPYADLPNKTYEDGALTCLVSSAPAYTSFPPSDFIESPEGQAYEVSISCRNDYRTVDLKLHVQQIPFLYTPPDTRTWKEKLRRVPRAVSLPEQRVSRIVATTFWGNWSFRGLVKSKLNESDAPCRLMFRTALNNIVEVTHRTLDDAAREPELF